MAASEWTPPADPDLSALLTTTAIMWTRDKPTVVAFDTETTGLEYHDQAFACTLAWHSDDIIQGPGVYGYYVELALPGAIGLLRDIFDCSRYIVGHNLKFDLHRAEAAGFLTPEMWEGKTFHDTEAMAHLIDEHRPKALKELAVSVLGYDDTIEVPKRRKDPETGEMVEYLKPIARQKWEIERAREWAKKEYGLASVRDAGYHLLPRGTVVPYAIKDAEWTLALAAKLHPQILAHPEVAELYDREIQLTLGAMYSLEKAGLQTRPEYVAEQIKVYRKKCVTHEVTIEGIVGKPVRTGHMTPKERPLFFNPASSDEIADYFTAAGFEGDSFDAEHLREIDHPLAAKLLEYRKDKKILESYFIGIQKAVGADGIFHPSPRQHGTVTGRTSGGAERGD